MGDEPVSLICFNEKKIKRLTIEKPLSDDEIKHSRIRIGVDMVRDYDPKKHEFEVIRKNKQ
ncbi:hypothetical protein [Methanosarcina mazei]|uniref:hypothetical protein n=1 Tax=Methanosarcina mazei TaxID=2209 RepID=UPI000AD7F973|nr:hypothetical protein [Methanosarcina mazei]